MAKIVAFFSIYDEFIMLPDAVESIKDYVDEMIFVDGRYKGFPGATPASSDGTVEYIKTLEKSKYYVADGLEEWEKWNLMFEFADPGAWIIMLGGDNVMSGAENLKNLEGRTTPLVQIDVSSNMWTRIFKNDGKGRFWHAHFLFEYDGKRFSLLKPNEFTSILPGVRIDNNSWQRDNERKEQMSKYFELLNKQEQPYYDQLQ